MIFHPAVEVTESTINLTKKVNLDKIEDWNSSYYMQKIQSKNQNPILREAVGTLYVIANETQVALLILGNSDFLKTSPIINVTQEGKYYLIETVNSVYRLNKVE